MYGLSQQAAREYLYWWNQKAASEGSTWRYRLPSDEEWERAARGVDRRHFVWGNYLAWGFCWSYHGTPLWELQVPGVSPMDESVFGVRDFVGSVREHTSGIPERNFRTSRGGSFDDLDPVYFRLASRNGFPPYASARPLGVRLAADLPAGEN